jgi:hypothetical protein
MPTPCHLSHVPDQFASLNAEGERLATWAGFDIPIFDDDRYSVFHDGGGRDNHFQGVQRAGNHLFVTGGYPFKKKRSDLFVFELGSRSADPGPFGSNLMRAREPASVDRLVACCALDSEYWHAGSFAIEGSSLIVPLESSAGASVLTFVDVSDPARPKRTTVDSTSPAR